MNAELSACIPYAWVVLAGFLVVTEPMTGIFGLLVLGIAAGASVLGYYLLRLRRGRQSKRAGDSVDVGQTAAFVKRIGDHRARVRDRNSEWDAIVDGALPTGELAEKGNTLIVPANLGDMALLVASAMAIVRGGGVNETRS